MQSRVVGLITLIVSIAYAILYRYFLPKMREKTKQYHYEKDNLFNNIVDSLSNITLLKSFFNKNVESSFDNLSGKLYDAYLRNISLNSTLGALHFCTQWTSYLIAIIVSGYLVFEGQMPVSSFVVVFATIGALNYHLQTFARGVADFVKLHGTVENTLELLLTEEDFKDLDKISLSEEPSLDYKGGDFEIKGLTFAYHKKDDKNIFENFNLSIKEKETVALVGKSGAGKSTLVALLQRFYDAEKGGIFLGGENVYEYNEDSLREHITYIPQDTSLFSMSVYDNIAYAKPEASREEVLNAAKLANADEFIEKLPNGYDELVGERGFRLSGGQKQRVAIARAILKNSPIVIMDEATSALDSNSEVLIQQSLDYLLKDKTCIIIAHRLSTIKSADRILVLEDGKIAQEGSHNQLIRKEGAYKNLWSLQQGGFIE